MKQSGASPRHRAKRFFVVIASVILVCAVATLSISAYVCASVEDRIIPLNETANIGADAILVLGARVWDNGEPSGILADRLDTGVAAYKAGASCRLLMSGDHGQADYDEVNAMKTYAVKAGIPSSSVFMDHAGFSTYESLYRARDVFQVKSVVIVTQRYHLYRALYIANRMGLTAYGIASDLHSYSDMPRYTARELLARTKDFFYTLFMPLPTYLGASVPITGDGNQTNG